MLGLPRDVLFMCENGAATTSRRDLVDRGHSEARIAWWLEAGLFERTGRGEFRVAGSDATVKQALATRLWRAGAGARLAGPLRCALAGLKGFPFDGWDHIAIPPHRRVRGVDFKVVRTPLPEEDLERVEGLPAVTLARALIGASATCAPARIRLAYDDARFKKLITAGQFEERALALGNAYGAAQARAIAAGGALSNESEPERNLHAVFRPGDPLPEAQVWVRWRQRWHRLDFAFRSARLALEYDGSHHEATREQDADRDLALAELDIETIRITKSTMRDPADVRRRVLTVHARRQALHLPPILRAAPDWA